jgi:hypothetical protein
MRPKSLREVAEWAARGESFDLSLKEFLDEFYAHPSQESLTLEPQLLDGIVDKGDICDAYLAAVAETLACKYHLDTPSWSYASRRQLTHPWFAMTADSLRAILLHGSPAAFRSRNLFVSENALSRA